MLADLEWNPRSIYQTIIQREETETGVKSSKNHDASAEECLQNDEVREIMTKNLSTLSRLVEGKVLTFNSLRRPESGGLTQASEERFAEG